RFDPWVLGTTPDYEERYHFYEDPVKVVFNDIAVVQLFAAYGKQLRIEIRAADGLALPSNQITALDPVSGNISSAYRDTLAALAAAGLIPCTGAISNVTYGSYTLPVPLRPLMAYTLDIVVNPPNPVPADKATTLLYRRVFSTSRYKSVTDLINDLK